MSTLKTNNIQHVDRSDPSIIINTDGSVNIAGTMTYEDVTNVDAVGLITARSGIVVSSGVIKIPDGSVSAPSLTASSDTNSGFYFAGADAVGLVVGGSRKLLANSSGVAINNGDLTIDDKIIHQADTDTAIRFPAADTVSVETAGTQRVRINSDGDVFFHNFSDNIGSSSSGEGFEFRAGEALRLQRSGGLPLIVNRTTDDGDLITLRRDGSGKADFGIRSDALTIDVGGAERLRIASDGKIGIGITNPDRQFEVNANSANTFIRIKSSDTGNAGIEFGDQSDTVQGAIFQNSSDNSVRFNGYNNAERMRIDSSGDIGIDITDPVARLQVNSTRNAETDRFDATNYHLALRNPEDDNGEAVGLSFGITSNATKVGAAILHERDGGGSQGSLQFYTSSDGTSITERLRIASNGQVRMNTVGGAPAADLHVGGTGEALNAYFQTSRTSGAYHHYAIGNSGASLGYIGSAGQISGSGGATGFAFRSEADLQFCAGGNTERVRVASNGVVHINSVAGGQAVVAFGDPSGNSFQAQNRIGGDTIYVADESISSAISVPRNGCFAVITGFSDDSGTYPQPGVSGIVYLDMGASRNIKMYGSESDVGHLIATKVAYTSNVSDCDNGKVTVMSGDTQGTFRLVNRESSSAYYFQVTFL